MSYQSKSQRKLFATSLTAAMVASAVAPVAVSADDHTDGFPDVPKDHNYANAINTLAAYDVINGFEDGEFKMGETITRAQAAQMLSVIRQLGTDAEAAPFDDVKQGVWYSDAINALYAAGDIKGLDEDTFGPNMNITRAQIAQIIVQAYDIPTESVDHPFTDVKEDVWYTEAIETLYANDLINGTTTSTFSPNEDMKRGDFAWLLYNVEQEYGNLIEEELTVESVSAIDAMTISVTFDNGEVVEVALDEALVEGENEVTFEVDGVEYTTTVTYDVVHTSGVSGFIFDGTTPVEDATVKVGDNTATTNAKGYYELRDVAAGTADVVIDAEGYETKTVSDVKIAEDELTSLTEDISAALIDTTLIEVSGVVVDSETGAAINGATVMLESYDAENDTWVEVANVPTGSTGAYSIDQTQADPDFELSGEYRQTVKLDGYHEFTQDITLDDQDVVNELAGIQLDDIEALDVTGNVTDSTGADVVDTTTVDIYDAEGNVVANTTTTDGAYSFEDLQLMSGTYNLVVDDGTSAVSYTEFDVTEGTDVSHNVQLEEGNTVDATIGTESLSDTFGASGSDADTSDYTLELVNGKTVIDTQTVSGAATADEKTLSATFNRIAPGSYTVRVSGDYVVTEEFALTVDGDETLEDRAVPAGTLTGVVNDGANPISEASVNLVDESGNVVDTVETDATGNYTFTGVVAGDYTVEASAADFVDGSLDTAETVSKNTATTAGTLSLDAVVTTGDVSGYVREEGTLTPVDGATVTYYDKDGEEVATAPVSADGSYSLTGLDAAAYEVVVRNAGIETFKTTQMVEAGDDLTSVNYNVTEGGNASLEISVVDSEGNPVNAKVDGFDLADSYVDPTNPTVGFWELDATETDTVTFNNLSAGVYDLDIDVVDPAYVDVDTTASVAMGEAGELEIVVDEVAAQSDVNFRVVDETNTNVEDAYVVVFNEDGTIKDVLQTDVNGTQALALVDGNYTLAVYNNGYVVSEQDITVDGADVNVPVFQLSPLN